MKTTSQYLVFRYTVRPGRKTPVVGVHSKNLGIQLGEIRWFGRWRQFCFYPEPETIFNKGCLTDIQNAIDELMEERRAN